MKRVIRIIAFVGLVLGLFRLIGNDRFEPKPEAIPVPVPAAEEKEGRTRLAAAVKQVFTKYSIDKSSAFVPLGKSQLALLSRLQLASAADQTLDVQYYLFHDDDAGRALLAALTAAAERGVKVRLLIDDMDTAGRENNLATLAAQHPTLSIRVFNPVGTRWFRAVDFIARFPRSSRRMHNKSMTADGTATIVGGRNVGNEYFNVNSDNPFFDYDVLVTGKLAAEVVGEFDDYWYGGNAFDISQLGQVSKDESYDLWQQSVGQAWSGYLAQLEKLDHSVVGDLLESKAKPYPTDGELLYDPPEKVLSGVFTDEQWLTPKIAGLLGSAKSELVVVSAYFIPGDRLVEKFASMVSDGVSITVLTNSYAATDVSVVHAAYMRYRQPLLDAGVKLYELRDDNQSIGVGGESNQKKSSLHAKAFFIDRSTSFIGSFNLDPRSALQNTEMGVVLHNKEYTSMVSDGVASNIDRTAYRVVLTDDKKLSWIDGATTPAKTLEKEPGISSSVKFLLRAVALLPVEKLL